MQSPRFYEKYACLLKSCKVWSVEFHEQFPQWNPDWLRLTWRKALAQENIAVINTERYFGCPVDVIPFLVQKSN